MYTSQEHAQPHRHAHTPLVLACVEASHARALLPAWSATSQRARVSVFWNVAALFSFAHILVRIHACDPSTTQPLKWLAQRLFRSSFNFESPCAGRAEVSESGFGIRTPAFQSIIPQ
eukprot:91571-Rhodomonas_salina.2